MLRLIKVAVLVVRKHPKHLKECISVPFKSLMCTFSQLFYNRRVILSLWFVMRMSHLGIEIYA